MSTVTTSTSNIERSPNFVSKNAQSKNQAANPAAFAALLMSAEEVDVPVDTSTPLAKGKSTSADSEQDTDDSAPTDAGQLALAGLLTWQALSPGDSASKAQASSTQLGSSTAPNEMAMEPLPPVDPKGLPEPLTVASAAYGTLPPEKNATLTNVVTADPRATPGTLQSTSATPVALPPEKLVPAAKEAALPVANSAAATAVQATRDAFGNIASKNGAAKARAGVTRNQLASTDAAATGGATPTTPGGVTTGQTPRAEWLPRTTVDLALKQGWQGGSDTADDKTGVSDILSVAAKPESTRGNSDTGAQTGEHMQAGDRPSLEAAAADPSAASGLAPDNFSEMLDNLSGQIAYWATQGRQRASMTLGDDKNNPMDVNISVRDGEVHVAFEAAQGDVRDALAQSVEDMLRNLLESKGMTLGEVTIGQRQSSGNAGEPMPGNGQGNDQTGTARRTSGSERGGATDSNAPLTTLPRRPDIATRTKVDLFA